MCIIYFIYLFMCVFSAKRQFFDYEKKKQHFFLLRSGPDLFAGKGRQSRSNECTKLARKSKSRTPGQLEWTLPFTKGRFSYLFSYLFVVQTRKEVICAWNRFLIFHCGWIAHPTNSSSSSLP